MNVVCPNCERTITINEMAETVICTNCNWRGHPEQMKLAS